MKVLFLLVIAVLPMIAATQTQQVKPPLYSEKITAQYDPGILDTTRMYASKYGKTARLTQDNMPCVIPYSNTRPIPNSAKGKTLPNDIPNAWDHQKKPSQPWLQYPVPDKFPKVKRGIPDLWEKDSVMMRIAPQRKK